MGSSAVALAGFEKGRAATEGPLEMVSPVTSGCGLTFKRSLLTTFQAFQYPVRPPTTAPIAASEAIAAPIFLSRGPRRSEYNGDLSWGAAGFLSSLLRSAIASSRSASLIV